MTVRASNVVPDSARWALVADVGGTHTRLALARSGTKRPELSHIKILRSPESTLLPTLRDYLKSIDHAGGLYACAVAAAGRVRRLGGQVRCSLTNTRLTIDQHELSTGVEASASHLINDLAAVAAAVPILEKRDYIPLGMSREVVAGMRLVIGVGTGFGVAALGADGALIESEGGHSDLAAVSAEERELLNRLAPLGRISIESVISGPGLTRLYHVISGQPAAPPELIVKRALGEESAAMKTLGIFSTWFGRSVGNMILSFGAWGGVYLVGGALEGLSAVLNLEAFRAGLADKAPFGADVAAVPVLWIRFPQPALLGLAQLALATPAG